MTGMNQKENNVLLDIAAYQQFTYADRSDNQEHILKLCRILDIAIEEYLEGKQKEYLKLHYFDGLSQREIATMHQVNPSTVSRTIDRAKRRIEKVVGIYVGGNIL